MSRYKQLIGLSLLVLMIGAASTASAQQSPSSEKPSVQNNNQTGSQRGVQPLLNINAEVPTLRTGVDPTKIMKLSMQDAVIMALEHNLGIKADQENIRLAQYDLDGAFGVYDLTIGSGIDFRRSSSPSVNRFSGAGNSSSLTQQSFSFNFLQSSKLFSSGARGNFSFSGARATDNSTGGLFSPSYNSSLAIDFTQPLLRNFRVNDNTRRIKILKKQLDISDLNFRQKLIALVAQVQSAYFDLAFATKNLVIQRESVELAAVQLRNNEIQVKAGTMAVIDVVSAQAEVESRKGNAIAALLPITTAENALKALIIDDPSSDMLNYAIEPTDSIEVLPETLDLSTSINVAMEHRPEIKQLQLQGDLNQIDLEYFKNQAKPQVDVVSKFSTVGFAGQVKPAALALFPPGTMIPFQGGFSSSLGGLFDSRTYEVGISINLPLHNRTAQANLGRNQVAARQLDTQKRQMIMGIVMDVRNAMQQVDNARLRVETATVAIRAAEEQLKGEEQKFSAGLSTNFFVLQRQNELSIARGNELRAKTDYNKAKAELQRVMANNMP